MLPLMFGVFLAAIVSGCKAIARIVVEDDQAEEQRRKTAEAQHSPGHSTPPIEEQERTSPTLAEQARNEEIHRRAAARAQRAEPHPNVPPQSATGPDDDAVRAVRGARTTDENPVGIELSEDKSDAKPPEAEPRVAGASGPAGIVDDDATRAAENNA